VRIAAERLHRQRLTAPASADPAALVSWFGAVQAQDYRAAKWALAVRMRGAVTDAYIERAFNDARIVRTHVMRPTWHFVSATDIRWLLALTAPRVHRAIAFGRRQNDLPDATVRRAARVIERSLSKRACMTRPELGSCLAAAGIRATGVRLAIAVIYAELEGLICSGPLRGSQHTYMLLEQRVPQVKPCSRDEALGELATRYFQSHGPATVRDFVWWSGLTVGDARRALEIARGQSATHDGLTYWTVGPRRPIASAAPSVHLLPAYDEYLVAYRDKLAVPRDSAFFGLLPPAILSNGRIVGTWKAAAGAPTVMTDLARRLSSAERQRLGRELRRYSQFAAPAASPIDIR